MQQQPVITKEVAIKVLEIITLASHIKGPLYLTSKMPTITSVPEITQLWVRMITVLFLLRRKTVLEPN